MKKILQKIFKELLALAAAVLLIIGLFSLLLGLPNNETIKKIVSTDKVSPTHGIQNGFEEKDQAEVNLMASLYRKDQITILGSSELKYSKYAPFEYLPNSLGVPTMAFGHAFHQSFSMYCELLAGNKYLNQSKICIIFSPSWFGTDGTNSEAFIEFVQPNFLKQIYSDDHISTTEKNAIGEYVLKNKDDFSEISFEMMRFEEDYVDNQNRWSPRSQLRPLMNKYFPFLSGKKTAVLYELTDVDVEKKTYLPISKSLLQELRENAIKASYNNEIYVDSAYYTTYLMENGVPRRGVVAPIAYDYNQEYEDFLILVELLKSRNADVTFVIQTLNPLFYENLEVYTPLVNKVTKTLDNSGIPYLNMFTAEPSNYDPGTLKDIMHLGDLGWVKISQFLIESYKL